MLKQTLFLLVIGMMSLSMASCAGAGGFSNEKIRYKMTVTVETPEGIKTGSAVREAARYTEPNILPEQGGAFYSITKGEAVVVDLGQRGVLFALLGGQREAIAVYNYFNSQKEADNSIELVPEQYPNFVKFKDMNDPKSISSVWEKSACSHVDVKSQSPQKCSSGDSFEQSFGANVSLISVTISKSVEAPQFGTVKQHLVWFREAGYSLGIKFFDPRNPEAAKYFVSDDFQIGAIKQ